MKNTRIIMMGLNTDPYWEDAEVSINRWKAEGNESMVCQWEDWRDKSLVLKEMIEEAVEQEGECKLVWSCTGRTRHAMHAHNWSRALPQYEFEIGDNYECIVRKRR